MMARRAIDFRRSSAAQIRPSSACSDNAYRRLPPRERVAQYASHGESLGEGTAPMRRCARGRGYRQLPRADQHLLAPAHGRRLNRWSARTILLRSRPSAVLSSDFEERAGVELLLVSSRMQIRRDVQRLARAASDLRPRERRVAAHARYRETCRGSPPFFPADSYRAADFRPVRMCHRVPASAGRHTAAHAPIVAWTHCQESPAQLRRTSAQQP